MLQAFYFLATWTWGNTHIAHEQGSVTWSLIFLRLKVQLLVIYKKKHEEQNIEIDNRNVKIDKKMFMEICTHEEWLQLFQECHSHCWEDRSEFICVYSNCKKNSNIRINEHWGCDKIMDAKRNPFTNKLYPPLKQRNKRHASYKNENILEYRAKLNALSKLRHSHPLFILTL